MEPHPALVAAVMAGAAAFAAPLIVRYAEERRLARECTRRRTLVLTYDDGPGADATPGLVGQLGALGVRATFFALGREAERRPEVLDLAVRAKHEVGCHSYAHVHPWRSVPWRSARDVGRGFRALTRWVPPGGLFRPPHGKLTPWTWAAVRARGASLAWWTIDSGDTWAALPAASTIVARVRRAQGGVVLMHDFDRSPHRRDYVSTLTEHLIRMAREEGLRVLPYGRLLCELSAARCSAPAVEIGGTA